MVVADRVEETTRIDFQTVAGSVAEGRFRFFREKDDTFVLPPRDLPLAFQHFTGTIDAVTIAGLTTGEPVDVPVDLNGARIGTWRVGSELSAQRLTLDPHLVRKGRNVLTLKLSGLKEDVIVQKARLRLLAIDFTRTGEGPRSAPGLFYYKDSKIDGYWQDASCPEMRTYVPIGVQESTLRLSVGWEGGCRGSIEWIPEGGARREGLRISGADRDLEEHSLELDGEGVGCLVMRVSEGRVFWGSPRVALPGAAPTAATVQPRRFNLLIYLVDTLRADALQPYGYGRGTSPFLRDFARECMVFTNVLGHTAWTKPSVATLLTGLYPSTHAVSQHDRFLHPKIVTLAERLDGFQRVFVTTHPVITRETGYAQGFDPAGYYSYPQKQAPEVAALLEPLLSKLDRSTPFFLYVHTIDPHYPYDPAPPFDRLVLHNGSLVEREPEQLSKAFIAGIKRHSAELGPKDVEYIRSLYDSEVARTDYYFGKVVSYLKGQGLYDDTMIIFTADHGEEFREHGGFQHGHTLYQEIVRLPWIIKPPKGLGSPGIVHDRIQQVDLVPTLLELLGKAPAPELPGASFAPVFSGGTHDAGTVFAETELDSRLVSAVYGRWKLIMTVPANPAASQVELYDLDRDPGEARDEGDAHPMVRDFLRQELRQWETEITAHKQLSTADATRILSDQDVEALKALGYVD